jgi:uncharacterized SAM-binding protein YcdF (DUF218 family)
MMAVYAARSLRVPARSIIVEDQSRSTVENVANSLPLLADSAAIKIASDTFHARRARRVLRDESPKMALRLARARDYVPLEWGPLHAFLALHEAYRRRRARPRAQYV